MYLAEILEWKVEKFPKKNVENEAVKEYSKLIDNDVKGRKLFYENIT